MSRCDSHVHIIGPTERYPQLANRSGVMGVADVAALKAHGAPHGISRFVVVQPSFYGTDNSMLLDALAPLGMNGRGVAVVGANGAPEHVLAGWAERGVCGLRINVYSPIGAPRSLPATFTIMADIARPLGWHVEVIAALPQIAEHADLFAAADVPVVIDHYGVYGDARPDSQNGRRLLELMTASNVWMKLSAPYRVSSNPLDTKPNRAWLTALIEAAPERCVWGSDWPHTPAHESTEPAYRPIDYAALVKDFLGALDGELRDAVMQHNPARLYGFPGA